ncbi:MAG: hypothetical protein R3194_05100 [Limnobacter sp.]|nr:hypothetical protein [Limnobacter sp.]
MTEFFSVFTNPDVLLLTAVLAVLISLALAWVSSFIMYGQVAFLKKLFPAPFQLIRAHIDFLMMAFLLGLGHYFIGLLELQIPAWVIVLFCLGAIYNPIGFIFLAINPALGKPQTTVDRLKIYIGFLPVTIGSGYVMVASGLALLNLV